jgi:hypothetical protein
VLHVDEINKHQLTEQELAVGINFIGSFNFPNRSAHEDLSGHILDVNPGLLQFSWIQKEDLIGQHVDILVHRHACPGGR